jgi:hypothetical protein
MAESPNTDPNAGKGLRDNLKASEIAARELGKDLAYALENLAESTKILDKQARVYKDLAGSSQLLNYTAKDNVQVAKDLTALYESELQASNDLVLKRNMVATGLRGEYAQLLTTYMLENDIVDVNDSKVQLLAKQLHKRQQISDKLEEERSLNEEIANSLLEIQEETESWKKGFDKIKATAQAIANDPKTLAFFLFNEGVKNLEKMHGTFEEMHHMGLSAGQAMEATFNQMDITSMDWWLGLSDTKGVMQGIVSEYGNVNALSKETVSQLGKMATSFGISGEEAAKINASLSQMPGETSETAAAAMETVGSFAKMQGIAPGKIMKDMAQNTEAVALYGSKGAVEFGKSVVELHKMGVEVATASKMAEGLLDFENSINKQMEASVLLGKEINLDKARELALSGDLAGSTAEVLKNIGGSAEFEKMNVMQKKALAEAAGMTVEELQKSIDAQEESNKYFGEGTSMGMNAMGYMMQYGGAAAGFFKENGMLLMTSVQFMSQFGLLQKLSNGLTAAGNFLLSNRYVAAMGFWVKEKAQWAAEKAHMLWKATTERLGFAQKSAQQAASAASTATSAAGSAASGAGAAAGLTGLATGLSAMGTPAVLFGALNLVAAVPGLVLMVAAIPFLTFIAFGGIAAGAGLSALGGGLTAMANPMLAMAGVNLMAFALASVVGVAGIPFLAMIALVGIPAGAGLSALGAGLSAMANPAVAIGAAILSGLAISLGASILMMGVGIGIAAAGLSLLFAELAKMPIESMLLLPVALGGIAVGLGALAVSSFFAFPGLMLASFALGSFAAVLAIMQPIMEMGGLLALAEGLTALASSAGGLSEVSAAVLGIGGGLGMMALAGLAALPIIGALVGLAAVAPALSSLGSMFGGGEGGGKEEDKMQLIADKLDQLIAVASKGGEVNMDGKKVGQIIKLGLNSSNVR